MKTKIAVSLFWMYTILAGIVQAQPVQNISKNTSHATIQNAIDTVTTTAGDTITVAAGIYELSAQINVTKPVSLIGTGGVTLKAISDFGTSNSTKHLLSIYTGTEAVSVSILNITLDCNSKCYGLNTYNNAYVVLNGVTVMSSKGAALTVNGSTIIAASLNTSGNVWGAVNVDPGVGVTTASVFTLGSGNLEESNQIWSDGAHVGGSATVAVTASGYNMYKKGGTAAFYVWTNRALSNVATIGTTMYTTIQAAVSASSSGDIISVAEGTFTEQIVIGKNITLDGSGRSFTNIVSPSLLETSFTTKKAIITVRDTSNVVIKNLTVDGAGLGNSNYQFTGIGFYRAGGTVDSVEVKGMRETPANGNQHGAGVYVNNDSGVVRNVTVSNCTIHDYQKGGIVLNGAMTVGTANNNIVTGLGPVSFIAQNGIQFGFGASGTVSNNTVTGNVWTGKYSGDGTNDPISDPNADASAGILVYMPGTNITIADNSLTANQFGVSVVAAPGTMPGVDIHDNTITGLSHTGFAYPVGIGIWSSDQWTPGFGGGETATTANIQNNTITNHDYGIVIFDYSPDGAVPHATVQQNAITNNMLFGAWSNVATDATNNWWGSSTGPFHATTNPSGTGDAVSDNVDYSPWESAVPVELTSFTVAPNNSAIELKWKTATEINNHGFEVERRMTKDAGSWQKIAFVQGAGTTNAGRSYSYTDKTAMHGRYSYRLKQIDNDGTFKYSQEVEAESGMIPAESSLSQNYPNPFNPSTVMNYQLAVPGRVNITVCDMLGREVARLVDEQKEAGYYSVTFGGIRFASGIYYSRFVMQTPGTPSVVKTIKMQLIK